MLRKYKFPVHAKTNLQFYLLWCRKQLLWHGHYLKRKQACSCSSSCILLTSFRPSYLFTHDHRTIDIVMFGRPRRVITMTAPERNYEFEITIYLLILILFDLSYLKFAEWVTSLLGAYVKLRKATISFVTSVLPSFCPHGTTRFPKNGFSWNLTFEYVSKICRENSRFVTIEQE